MKSELDEPSEETTKALHHLIEVLRADPKSAVQIRLEIDLSPERELEWLMVRWHDGNWNETRKTFEHYRRQMDRLEDLTVRLDKAEKALK